MTPATCLRPLLRPSPLSLAPLAAAAQPSRNVSKQARAAVKKIKVLLLQDTPKYGRKGQIVPVNRGTMRAIFFPAKTAAYLTPAQQRDPSQLPGPAPEVLAHADTSFRPDLAARREPRLTLRTLAPSKVVALLQQHLPAELVFDRATTGGGGGDGGEAEEAIHGSVSAADVAEAMTSVLADLARVPGGERELARVVVTEDMVRLLGDKARRGIRATGRWEVDVGVRGVGEMARRTVVVRKIELDI